MFLCFFLPFLTDHFSGKLRPTPGPLMREISKGSSVAACIYKSWCAKKRLGGYVQAG